jgi:hypothetical protein
VCHPGRVEFSSVAHVCVRLGRGGSNSPPNPHQSHGERKIASETIFFFQASRSARPPRLLAALGFGGSVRSGRRREVREAALGWRSRSSISPAAAALHPALGRRRSPSSFSRRRSPSRPQPPPVSIPLQPPPPLSFPLSIPASRRRSPSLLPRFGFTGCGRGQGRGQQPGHQEASLILDLLFSHSEKIL